MTEEDKKLCEYASAKNLDWQEVYEMIKKAKSQEAKKFLHDRCTSLYRTEEFNAGLL